ncbi:hypothetical protein THAOC_14356 [Thalassiosira oceanica]|uniref:Uncharacterized protein n=1 Tax=Thalassiosira oceanica TaxID=159749 RepID=K0SUZ4_THAOC|nr:hypothetical protein THAOC_14356 [Thalassiosira oceanica]|eukprot:EJK64861.1 hypothetical protein THAOC_14356 [Thalassiosira oceanica]
MTANSFSIRQRGRQALSLNGKMSKADEERLLLTEPALNAFIVAEMRHFLTAISEDPGRRLRRWELSDQEKIDLSLVDDRLDTISEEYETAKANLSTAAAIDLLCNATQATFHDGYTNEPGLMTALGSAIVFFQCSFRGSPELLAACEVVGLSDYAVAHHITDMYHHRTFRGTYTKTLAPSGEGEVEARRAVGLDVPADPKQGECGQNTPDETDDECLLWSPTTPGVCLNWKSEEEDWRRKRFERVQMEGDSRPQAGRIRRDAVN